MKVILILKINFRPENVICFLRQTSDLIMEGNPMDNDRTAKSDHGPYRLQYRLLVIGPVKQK